MKRKRKPLKKSFASFFFRVWIPFLCLALIGFYFIFSLFSSYVADATMRMQENQFNIYLANTITDMNKGYMNYNLNETLNLRSDNPDLRIAEEPFGFYDRQYWAEIQFQLAMTGTFGPTSLYMLDEDGYHEVMNSLERYYMSVQFGNEDPCFFSCEKSVINELLNNSGFKIRKKDLEQGNIFIRLNDFYIKDDQFIPGDFDLYDKGTYIIGFGESERLEGNFKDYVGHVAGSAPSSGDYIHYTVSDDVTVTIEPILLGSKETAEERWESIRKKNPSAGILSFEQSLDSPFRFDFIYGEKNGFLLYNLSWNRLDSPFYGGYDGQTLTAVSVGYFNALESFGTLFLVIGIFLLLFVTMVCIIIALPIYRDYRERYLMEQYRKTMTDTLAHDLKSPLMAISGYAENLKLDAFADKKEYYLDSIIKTTSYMNAILCDMFELEGLENDQDKMKQEIVNLREVTESAIRRYESSIAQKKLQVSMEGEASMQGDSYYMGRAIDNLVGNAVKFTPEGREITIRIENGLYRITNTGVTIPPEKLSTICEPFVKGSSERSNQSGTGLGLSIVNHILALHNLELSIESAEDITQFSFHFHMKDSLSEDKTL